jgi:hypothetical protein
MEIVKMWNEGMSSDNPGCIFGLLQLILGKQQQYEGEEIYLHGDEEV